MFPSLCFTCLNSTTGLTLPNLTRGALWALQWNCSSERACYICYSAPHTCSPIDIQPILTELDYVPGTGADIVEEAQMCKPLYLSLRNFNNSGREKVQTCALTHTHTGINFKAIGDNWYITDIKKMLVVLEEKWEPPAGVRRWRLFLKEVALSFPFKYSSGLS